SDSGVVRRNHPTAKRPARARPVRVVAAASPSSTPSNWKKWVIAPTHTIGVEWETTRTRTRGARVAPRPRSRPRAAATARGRSRRGGPTTTDAGSAPRVRPLLRGAGVRHAPLQVGGEKPFLNKQEPAGC